MRDFTNPSWSDLELHCGRLWGLGGSRLTWGDKEVTMQYLEPKGGDRGACKLLGDVIEVLGCLLEYGKIWYDEDVHDLRSVETEYPAIAFNDELSSEKTLSCEPMVSSLNYNQIDFRISFDEFDDEDYTYTDADIVDFEMRLAKIYRREVHMVQVFDFRGLTDLMAKGLRGRMLMEHRDVQGLSVFTSRAWRRPFEIRGPLVHELILEFFSTFRFREVVLELDTVKASQFQLGGARHQYEADPRQGGSKCLLDMDLVCGGFSGYTPFLYTYQGSDIEIIPQVATAGSSEAAEDVRVADEGTSAIPALVQAPQPLHLAAGPARTMTQRLARVEEDVHEIRGALGEQRDVLDSMACDFS
ncbi:hypothetical protein Tco_0143433 [Tanacetum coccineum]